MSNTVPSGWEKSDVNSTCEILDSKRIPLNSQERAVRQGEYPYYGANGVQGYIDDFIFEGEHVLLAEDGGNFDQWEFRPISYLVSGKFWVNNHAHILKAKGKNETRFIHYSLVHKNILKHINGGTRAKLNQSDMRDITLLRPPLPEQQKIAAILSTVDDVIEKTRAQIDKLKDLKTGMMQELLTKGIGHTEFKDSPVGRIPADWGVAALSDVVEVVDSLHQTPSFTEVGKPMVRATEIRKAEILNITEAVLVDETTFAKFTKNYVPAEGDILIARVGAYFGVTTFVAKTELFCIGQNTASIRPVRVNPFFVFGFLNSESVRKQMDDSVAAGAQPSLSLKAIKEIIIPLPSKNEQLKIGEAFDSMRCKIDVVQQRLDRFMSLKKALMQDLLTGKVRVKIDDKESAVA